MNSNINFIKRKKQSDAKKEKNREMEKQRDGEIERQKDAQKSTIRGNRKEKEIDHIDK